MLHIARGLRRLLLATLPVLSTLLVAQSAMAEINGPDVSSWQHPGGAAIDWAAVRAAGQPFAFVKATEDTTYANPYFATDWAAIKAAGMFRGSYHFARPASPAVDQANYFISRAGPSRQPGDLPPVLDLEDTGGLPPPALVAWTQAFLSRVQALIGRAPMIYVSPNFWVNAMGDSHAFTNYPLWIARWTSAATPDPLPGGWPSWTFWQYTNQGSIPGIPTRVDVSHYCCDSPSLSALALGAVLPPPGNYHPFPPRRIVDTRSDSRLGPWSRIGGGQTLTLQVAGTSQSGLPISGVGSVAMNITAANPSWWGHLIVFQTGGQPGSTSTLNFNQAQTAANLAVVPLGTLGDVSIYNSDGWTDVVVDVVGFTTTATSGNDGRYRPLPPSRIDDTRAGMGQPHSGQALGPYQSMDVQVVGAGQVPASGVEAVALNITATESSATSYLTAYPTGTGRPNASNVNFSAFQTVANRAITQVGSGGKITIYNDSAAVNVVVDVNGWYTDGSNPSAKGIYTAVNPARVLDTRPPPFRVGTIPRLGPGQTVNIQIAGGGGVPAMWLNPPPTSAILNLTIAGPDAAGWVTMFPGGTALPTASDVNFGPGQTVANLVVATLGANGSVNITNQSPGGVEIIVDVEGWFS